tara:strand:+ start:14569 stop:15060 length:492 start_codon:yes stop_codon:yes gene_type:complete
MKNTNKYRQIRKSCTRAYDEATLVYPLKVRDVGAIRKRSFQHHRAVIVRDTPTLEAVLDYDNSENEELIDEGCNIVLKLTDPSQALEGLLVYAHSIDWEDKEMSKKKKYEVVVWDLSYALKDEDGNYKHDSKGNVEVYDYPDEDCQHLAEYLKPEDLDKRDGR